jgi:hypothetical protein
MGFDLEIAIASTQIAERVADAFGQGVPLVPLEQGLAFVPFTDAVHDALIAPPEELVAGFWKLPRTVAGLLAALSTAGPVAYAELDYFGGVGHQAAAVWDAGELVWGPCVLGVNHPVAPEGTPVSCALKRLGAVAAQGLDEFDTVGLSRHRHMEEWETEEE